MVSFSALSVGLSGIAHTCKQLLQITSEVIIITSLHQLQACRNVMSVIRHKLGVPQSNRSITHLTYLVCIYDMSVCGWTKVYFLNTALISCKFLWPFPSFEVTVMFERSKWKLCFLSSDISGFKCVWLLPTWTRSYTKCVSWLGQYIAT